VPDELKGKELKAEIHLEGTPFEIKSESATFTVDK
jgi:hypothetical protein